MNPQLSVVIVNFNTLELTRNCIQSVLTSSPSIHLEIIVVDNASKLSPVTLLKEFGGIKLIENATNLGFGVANNIGMQKAKGNYILLLNSDTIVSGDCLQKCLNFMEDQDSIDNKIGMIGCRVLNQDLTLQPSVFPYLKNNALVLLLTTNPVLVKISTIFNSNRHQSFDYSKTQQVGDIAGAFMFLRNAVYKNTKGFDPDFFLYGEDTEWCRERVNRVQKIYYFPHASIIHFGGQSAPSDLMFVQSLLSNALMWYKKGPLSYMTYMLVVTVNCVTYLVLFPFFKKQTKELFKKYAKGFMEIFKQLILDIPFHSRRFGGRKKPLIVERARKIFFPYQSI